MTTNYYVNVATFQGLTMLRQADHCFLLNTGFTDQFSNNMDDWFEVYTLLFFLLSVLPVVSHDKIIRNYFHPALWIDL